MNEIYGVQFKTDIESRGELLFQQQMFNNTYEKTSKEQAIEFFNSIKDTTEAYLICTLDVIIDVSDEVKNVNTITKNTIQGIYGEVSFCKVNENLNNYSLDIKDVKSNETISSGSNYGLPNGITNDEYFKMALIQKLDEIKEALTYKL